MSENRPLCFFDLESTSTDPATAHIVQVAAIVPGREPCWQYVNPGVPIPAEATAVHGITDATVKDFPPFRGVAPGFATYLAGCDLVGFNIAAFDVPLLAEEFARAGVEWDWKAHLVLDVGVLCKRLNPRDLGAMFKKYTGGVFVNAHDALADARAVEALFWAVLRQNLDLGRLAHEDREAFAAECRYEDEHERLDPMGRLVLVDGVARFNFGKHQGEPVLAHRGYCDWMLGNGFPETTKVALRKLLTVQG